MKHHLVDHWSSIKFVQIVIMEGKWPRPWCHAIYKGVIGETISCLNPQGQEPWYLVESYDPVVKSLVLRLKGSPNLHTLA